MALTFPSMDAGAQFVEECFLEVAVQHALLEPPTRRLSLLEILTVSLQAPRFALPPRVQLATVAQQLEQACAKHSLSRGQVLMCGVRCLDQMSSLCVIVKSSVFCMCV